MNVLDKYIYLYSRLYKRKHFSTYLLSPFRRIVRWIAAKKIPPYLDSPLDNESIDRTDIIVSLTSFPERINKVYQVVQCMLRQTKRPQKIILWLSKLQFKGVDIPQHLLHLQSDIFEIRFVEGDIRSHKKYHYVLKEYPDNPILLIDDDLYYPSDMIEKMIQASLLYPGTIICRYGSIAKYKNNKLLPYNDWWYEEPGKIFNPNFFFGTGGGTLLKKSYLFEDVLDLELALKLTPLADDIWINAMANLKNTPKYKVDFGLILPIDETQTLALSKDNVSKGQNDIQLNNIIDYYVVKLGKNPFEYKSL